MAHVFQSSQQWLASLTPALAKIQREREAEIAALNQRHAAALEHAIAARSAYKRQGTSPQWSGAEAVRLGSIWTNALAGLMYVRTEIREAGYALPAMPREAYDVSVPA